MLRIYNFFRLLSLDVVVGAIILASFLGKYLSVDIPLEVYIGLGGAVWLIYVVDHLVDAKQIKHKPNTYRHRFHQKYFKPLVGLSVVLALGLVYVATKVPFVVLQWSAVLAVFLLAYFILIWFVKSTIPKEFIVSVIYSLGVFLGPVSLNNGIIDLFGIMLLINLIGLAFLNLFLFSFFDMEKDKMDGHSSIPLRLGAAQAITVFQAISFGMLMFDLCLIFIFRGDNYQMLIMIVFVLMLLVLISLFSFKSFFGAKEKYRMIGDAMFFLPALLLI